MKGDIWYINVYKDGRIGHPWPTRTIMYIGKWHPIYRLIVRLK